MIVIPSQAKRSCERQRSNLEESQSVYHQSVGCYITMSFYIGFRVSTQPTGLIAITMMGVISVRVEHFLKRLNLQDE